MARYIFNEASPFNKRFSPIVDWRYNVFRRRNVDNDLSLVVVVTDKTDIARNIL